MPVPRFPVGPPVLHPELGRRRGEFEANLKDLEALLSDLSETSINWRPAPGSWSVAECVEHLNRTAEQYLPRIDAAMAEGREKGLLSQGPYRHGLLGDWLVRSMEPPVRLRLPAPRLFRPAPVETYSPETLLDRFRSLHRDLADRLLKANGLDLGRIRTASPASRLLRLSLGQVFALLATHERRHLWQARHVQNHPSFPSDAGGGKSRSKLS